MADFRRYQPRSSRSGFRISGRLIMLVIGVVIIMVIVQAVRGGDNNDANEVANVNSDSGIQLRNDNANLNVTNSGTSGNTNSDDNNANTSEDANTNASSSITAPDASELDLTVCQNPISQFGTQKSVALTYNLSGTGPEVGELLSVLTKNKIADSFFVSGSFATKYPDVVRQVSSQGFGMYNRSNSNPKFSTIAEDQMHAQLEEADTAISGVTDRTTKPFFRPPLGDYSDASVAAAYEDGYCTMLWTVDALDWQDGATAAAARDRVVAKARNGAIVMLSAGYEVTPEATRLIAADLRKAGYSLVSLVELLGS